MNRFFYKVPAAPRTGGRKYTLMFTPPRLSCRKALAPLGLALLAGLLLPRPARAQWVPCKADGTLLPPSDPGFINDGGTFLVGSSPTPTSTPTGVYDKLTDWWLNAFGPSAASHRNSSLPGLSLDSFADNFASLPYSDSPVGYFAGNNSNLGGEWYSADLPPDITGGGKANSADTLTAYFAWVGSGPVPDHADFLLRTRVGATASVSYGRSASSGLSSSASATLGSDTASATASAPGDAHSQFVPGAHLKRVTASGGVVTVSLSGNVTTDASNSLPYEKWWTQDNRSWYYVGGGNGATSANASGSASATAYPDSREVTISSSLGQTYHKSSTRFDSSGVALPDPDIPDSDSTVHANTVKQEGGAGDNISIEYDAHPVGAWASGSSYFWHLSSGDATPGAVQGGTFSLPNDPPYSYSGQYGASVTGQEHAYIHLTDAGDGSDGTANYYVQWHDSVENWQKHGSSIEMQPTLYGSSNNPQPANGQVNVNVSSGQVNWSTPAKGGGGILTTAGAVIAIAQPETDPLIIGLLAAGGYSLSVVDPPAPTLYAIQGAEGQFAADIQTQEAINSGNSAGIFEPGVNRFSPPTLADTIYTSGDTQGSFNGFYGHSFTFGVQIYRHKYLQNYLGDGYGTSGYTGQATGTITTPGSLEYVYTWQ